MKYDILSFGATHIVRSITVKGARTFRKEIAVATSRAAAQSYIDALVG